MEKTNVDLAGGSSLGKSSQSDMMVDKRVGVHCVAGLGRAPFMVAMALVHNGCYPPHAIELIRKKRNGVLNAVQTNFILDYKDAKVKNNDEKVSSCSNCNIF